MGSATRNATARWKPPDSNARIAAAKPREEEQAIGRSGQPKESYFDSW